MATFTNRATLSYNGISTDSNTVTGTIQETLAVTKNAVIDSYSVGDNIVYVVNITNSGNTAFTDVTVTDDLGSAGSTVYPLTYVDGSVQYYANGDILPDPAVTAAGDLVISGITIPANSIVTLIYIARANAAAPFAVGSQIVNTVTVTGAGILTPLSATETVTVANQPVLAITKALTPTTVVEHGRVTYTFTITNSGNTAADVSDNVTVTDTFEPVLSDLVVTYDGTAWSAPANYTYDPVTGVFATVPGGITVPAATYTTAPDGTVTVIPSSVTLTVTGTI